jgi:hypothetical protein
MRTLKLSTDVALQRNLCDAASWLIRESWIQPLASQPRRRPRDSARDRDHSRRSPSYEPERGDQLQQKVDSSRRDLARIMQVDSIKRDLARMKHHSKHITCKRTSVPSRMRCSNEACGVVISPKRHRFYRKWHSLATIVSCPFSPSLC